MPREKWTDERLDDLNKNVGKGFEGTKDAIADTKAELANTKTELKAEIADTKAELKAEIADTKAELKAEIADTKAEMRAGFDRVHADIRELHRILYGGLFVVVAAIIGSNAF